MAFSLLQTKTGQKTVTTGTTFTVTLATTGTGNLVIITISCDASVTGTVSNVTCAGMTFAKIEDLTDRLAVSNTSMWYAYNITGNTTPTLTVTMTTGFVAGAIVREYSHTNGPFTTDPLDKHTSAHDASNNAAPSSGATATLTGSNDLVVGAAGTLDGGNTYTQGGGFGNATSLSYATATGDLGMEDKTLSGSTAAQTATFTITNISDWACIVSTFQAPSSGGVTPNVSDSSAASDTPIVETLSLISLPVVQLVPQLVVY